MRSKYGIILVFLLLFVFHLSGVERKKVGLVLGGGGAKGAAHVGVLKVLEEVGIPVDYVAGTSIGAIVGGLYASGYTATELDSIVRSLNWKMLLSDQLSSSDLLYRIKEREWKYVFSIPFGKQIVIPAGIINGQNAMNLFSGLTVGYHDLKSFSDLPIPFACVSTDMTGGKSIVLSSGSLPFAMRASMSIPGVFVPVELDSMVLVDGGVLNNLPTNVALDMGADITIGVDLSTGKESNSSLMTFSGMLNQLIDMMGMTQYNRNKEALDLCLNPDLSGFNTMSFSAEAVDSLYERGIRVAREHIPQLLALKERIYGTDMVPDVPTPALKRVHALVDTVFINRIYFEGLSAKEERWFRKEIGIREKHAVSVKEINEAISKLEGLDVFSSITYRISAQDPADLVFVLKKKALNQLNIGFRFDTESMASILLNTTLSQRFMKGSELSLTTKLDKNPYLQVGYNWGGGISNKLDINYQVGYHNFNLYDHKKRIDNIYFLWQSGVVRYLGIFKNYEIQAGLEWNFFGYNNELYDTGYNPLEVTPGSFVNYFASIDIDTYDDRYFPKRGYRAMGAVRMITDNFLGIGEDSPVGVLHGEVETALKLTDRFYVIPGLTARFLWGDKVPAIYQNCMGGDMNGRYLPQQIAFPGIRNIQVFKDALLVGKASLRCTLAPKQYLSFSGGYALQGGEVQDLFREAGFWCGDIRYSYNSSIGPISFQVNYSSWVKEVGIYINLGYNF